MIPLREMFQNGLIMQWSHQCIFSPESAFYIGNEDIIEQELDYILEKRNDDGVWDITWGWADYEKEFAISTLWWKALLANQNLLFLRAFKRGSVKYGMKTH